MSTRSKPRNCLFATVWAAALLAAFAANVRAAANPEPIDIEPEMLAKIAMEKARVSSRDGQTRSAAKKDQRAGTPAAECGAIAIGNVVGNNRIGFAPTDVNVVIVGDVINANNNCK